MPVELCWNFDQVDLVAWTECPIHPFAVDDRSSPSTMVVNMHAFVVIRFVFIVCQTKREFSRSHPILAIIVGLLYYTLFS